MTHQDELEGRMNDEVGQGQDAEGYGWRLRSEGDQGEGRIARDEVIAGELGSGEGDDTEGFGTKKFMRTEDQASGEGDDTEGFGTKKFMRSDDASAQMDPDERR